MISSKPCVTGKPQQDADFYLKAFANGFTPLHPLNSWTVKNYPSTISVTLMPLSARFQRPSNCCGSQTHEFMWDRHRWYRNGLGLRESDPVSIFGGCVPQDALRQLKNARCLPWNHCTKLYRWSAWNLDYQEENLRILELPFDAWDASKQKQNTLVLQNFPRSKTKTSSKKAQLDWQVVETPTNWDRSDSSEFAWKAIK